MSTDRPECPGCVATYEHDVLLCPLHAATPKLLAALKFVQAGLLQMGSDWSDAANKIVAEAILEAEKL